MSDHFIGHYKNPLRLKFDSIYQFKIILEKIIFEVKNDEILYNCANGHFHGG